MQLVVIVEVFGCLERVKPAPIVVIYDHWGLAMVVRCDCLEPARDPFRGGGGGGGVVWREDDPS